MSRLGKIGLARLSNRMLSQNSIGEKQNEGLRLVRQLLPLQRSTVDVVCCEPIRSQYDSKGNKMDALSSQTRHQVSHAQGHTLLNLHEVLMTRSQAEIL